MLATCVCMRELSFGPKWGHNITVVTCAPNFHGKLFAGYENVWHQTEIIDGIKVVRVKTYIAANNGVLQWSLDFFSYLATGTIAGLFQSRPDIVAATSILCGVAGWLVAGIKKNPLSLNSGTSGQILSRLWAP